MASVLLVEETGITEGKPPYKFGFGDKSIESNVKDMCQSSVHGLGYVCMLWKMLYCDGQCFSQFTWLNWFII